MARDNLEAPLESAAEELTRLRGCLSDLVSIMALPARWTGREPPQIASTLLDSLLDMLPLAFVLVRLNDPEGRPSIQETRLAEPLEIAPARDLGQLLELALGHDPLRWPASARLLIGDVELSVAVARLGRQGEIGVVVAGSRNLRFPEQAEKLLLEVAANQAALGLQQVPPRLREHERNSRLVDSIPGLVAILTARGEVEFVNRQMLEYIGRPLEQIKQWGTNDIIHPEDLPHVLQAFTQSIASGSAYEIELRARHFDGAYRWFQSRGCPLRDTSGQIVRWYNLLTDIDERKRAEEALTARERNLKLIIDTIPALAWSARPDGSAEFFNQHYLDFIGLSAELASGWDWATAVHPDDLHGLTATWQRILASEAAGDAEVRMRRQDGEYRWFLFRASPLRDENGNIIKWYGVNTDIEDRKRVETELRRAHDGIAIAQQLSRTGSFITDPLVDDHSWSEESFRIFEFDPATKITLQLVRDVVLPEDLAVVDSEMQRGMEGHDLDFVFRIVTRRGAVKHVRCIARVLERVAGRPVLVGALQDMTESKAAEEALSRARSELAHVARVTTLSALTASIAHEVNQPLSGIITNAGTCLRMLAADPPDMDGARETARRTIRDGHRASDVVTRLRALFTRKGGTMEPVDLNETTREVIALSSSELARGRVVLRLELAEGLPRVTGDRVQLQQVILNLLLNGSDAMSAVEDRPRQLVIRTGLQGGDWVRLSVEDAGIGVEAGQVERLFEAFYTTKSGGMGIGLSVSRSIIESHDGRLWVEPNNGPGATFLFCIPASA